MTDTVLLPGTLGPLADAAGDDLAFASLRLTVGDGHYTVQVTDGQCAVCVTGNGGNAAEYPDLPAVAAAPGGSAEALIPATAWKTAYRSIPKTRLPKYRQVVVKMGLCESILVSTNHESCSVHTTWNSNCCFPAVEKVIPTAPPLASISLSPARLAALCKILAGLTDQFASIEVHKHCLCIRVEDADKSVVALLRGVM